MVRIAGALAFTLALLGTGGFAAEPVRKPNIVIILADDLGYGDVKCFNPQGKIATPAMDYLAAQGMMFTDAHSASGVCTPTRYGLLTGRYCWRTKLKNGVLGGLSPRLIEPGRETLASMLRKAGYHTSCVGKWHLGMDWVLKPGGKVNELSIESREQVNNVDYTKPIANGPLAVGFDRYFGISASLDMVPYAFIENDRVVGNPTEDRNFPMSSSRANEGTTRKGPAVPGFEARDVLPTLSKKATDFIRDRTAASKAGTPFFLYLPLTSPHTPIAPSPEWRGKSKISAYADFVMQTDAAVGAVITALEAEGLTRDTLLIVTSDNGCSPQANYAELAGFSHNPSGPFRGTKADIYEGGHHVPLLVRWPAVVKPDSKSDQLVCLNDFFRTCCDAAGVAVPDSAAEDSFSFLPVLRGEKSESLRRTIVHHSINGSFAIREGYWKLCLCPGSGGWSSPRPGRDDASALPPVQLFDLLADLEEKVNLQARFPVIVTRLEKLLDQQAADGRSTPGQPQPNTVAVDVRKAGKDAMKPIPKKK